MLDEKSLLFFFAGVIVWVNTHTFLLPWHCGKKSLIHFRNGA